MVRADRSSSIGSSMRSLTKRLSSRLRGGAGSKKSNVGYTGLAQSDSEASVLYSWWGSGDAVLADLDDDDEVLSSSVVINVVGNQETALALTNDGRVYGKGSNAEGQLSGSEDEFARYRLLDDSLLSQRRIVQVALGQGHACFLSGDGFVVSCGRNDFGQLGHSRDREPYRVPPRMVQGLGKETITQIACSDESTFVLSRRGQVFAFGLGRHGVLGLGSESNQCKPSPVGGLLEGVPVAQLSTGARHVLALSVSGHVFAWGANSSKQLGVPELASGEHEYSPVPVAMQVADANGTRMVVERVAAGAAHSLLLCSGGVLFGCGATDHGQLGSFPASKTTKSFIAPPVELDSVAQYGPVAQIACGENTSAILLLQQDGGDGACRGGQVLGLGGPNKTKEMELFADSSSVFRVSVSGRAVVALACGKKVVAQRRDFVRRATTSHPLEQWTAGSLSQHASELERGARASRRRSLRTFQRSHPISLFSVHALNASFLEQQPSQTKSSASGVDVAGAVRSMGDWARALKLKVSGNGEVLYLRQQFAKVVAELDALAPAMEHPDQLRVFLILLLVPFSDVVHKEYEPLLLSLRKLPGRAFATLRAWIHHDVPSDLFLENIVRPALRVLDASYLLYHRLDTSCEFLCSYLQACFRLNQQRTYGSRPGFAPLKATDFYSDQLAAYREEDLGALFQNWRGVLQARKFLQQNSVFSFHQPSDLQTARKKANAFTIFDYPFLLSADAKRSVLQLEDRQSMFRNFMMNQLFHNSPYFVLEVDRENILEDTVRALHRAEPAEFRKPLRVKFKGEEGLDGGGVKKEFFQLLSAQLFSPEHGLFEAYEDSGHSWFRTRNLDNAPKDFSIAGALIGLAIYNSTLLDVSFPLSFWRILLRKMPAQPGLDELAELDPAYARNLRTMLEYQEDDFEDVFCATFSLTRRGDKKTVELKPGGDAIVVTRQNVQEYVQLLCSYLLMDSIKDFAKPLVSGFNLVIAHDLASLTLFQPSELELTAVGNEELDFNDLEYITTYEGGYSPSHKTIVRFWNVAKALSKEQKAQFMSFATGSPRAPVGGLKTTKFKIQRAGPDSERLVSSSTCFNTLLLPDYASEEKLRKKLIQSIAHNVGFGNE